MIASEYDFAFSLSFAAIVRGWALGMQGDPGGGLAEMRHYRLGAGSWLCATTGMVPISRRARGEEQGNRGRPNDGVGRLDMLGSTEERFYEAELHRVKGELLLMQSDCNIAQAAGLL